MARSGLLCTLWTVAAAGSLFAQETQVAGSMNRFATASYQQLARSGENIIFSPFSISSVLAMALEGARGETAREIAAVLHRSHSDAGHAGSLAALLDRLMKAANKGGNELHTANGLWIDKNFHVRSDFQDLPGAARTARLRGQPGARPCGHQSVDRTKYERQDPRTVPGRRAGPHHAAGIDERDLLSR
jgi:hypothetical protein